MKSSMFRTKSLESVMTFMTAYAVESITLKLEESAAAPVFAMQNFGDPDSESENRAINC
jgi:hypothetical protein